MNLPVIKPTTYISNTSFNQWGHCQNQFYQYRLAGHEFIESKQTRAAAAGLIFDAFVKDYIFNKYLKNVKNNSVGFDVNKSLGNIRPEGFDLSELIAEIRPIAVSYIKNKIIDRCIRSEMEIERQLYLISGGVPILGIIDLILNNNLPFEWKLRGFAQPAGSKTISPTAGYQRRWDHNGHEMPGHSDPIPLELINIGWAQQFCFYNWLLRNTDFKYMIHEICNHVDGFTIVEHVGKIGSSFADKIRQKLEHMWEKINGSMIDIEEPQPNEMKCYNFGQLCTVAFRCKKFQQTLGSATWRKGAGMQ